MKKENSRLIPYLLLLTWLITFPPVWKCFINNALWKYNYISTLMHKLVLNVILRKWTYYTTLLKNAQYNSLWDAPVHKIAAYFHSLFVCILTRPSGSSKYCRTRENIQRYCAPKHPIRYKYIETTIRYFVRHNKINWCCKNYFTSSNRKKPVKGCNGLPYNTYGLF